MRFCLCFLTGDLAHPSEQRYSIIGDTVNVASTMEATSKKGRIQCSRESAEKLMEQSHDIDVVRRGTRMIKGKGPMETFWVRGVHDDTSESSASPAEELLMELDEDIPVNKAILKAEDEITRLTNWNVDIFKKYLLRLIKYRQTAATDVLRSSEGYSPPLDHGEKTLLDEVTEVIQLPNFNARAIQNMKSETSVELPEGVEEQLRVFVATIAHMYKDNPFHSFQVRLPRETQSWQPSTQTLTFFPSARCPCNNVNRQTLD